MSHPHDRTRLRRGLLAALAALALQIAAPAGAAPPEGAALRVTGTGGVGLRLRQSPDTESAVLALLPEGATVVASGRVRLADGQEWAQVRHGDASGWAATAYLGDGAAQASRVAAPAGAPPASGGRATVAGTGGADLRIRGGIGLDAPVVGHAPSGATVTLVEGPRADATGAPWYGVAYGGIRGWASGRYLVVGGGAAAPVAPIPNVAAPAGGQGTAIAAAGLRYLGAPYVWGGNDPAGWDCSGFVVYVARQVTGRTLPRTTQAQIGVGTPVAPADIRAGDLVFFANTYAPGITHVGIALGDGRFVHARSPRHGTVISSLADPYYAPRFAGGRRL